MGVNLTIQKHIGRVVGSSSSEPNFYSTVVTYWIVNVNSWFLFTAAIAIILNIILIFVSIPNGKAFMT